MTTPSPAALPATASTRGRILDGAARALTGRGFRASTVQSFLDEAGVSRRTFYQHFRSKEDVLLALYEELADDLLESVRGAAGSGDEPARRLFAAIDAYLDFQQAGGDLLILLQAEAIRPDSLLASYREATLDTLCQFTSGEVERATGFVIDPLVFRALFLGMDGLVIHQQREGSFTAADRDRVRAVMRPVFLQVLAGGTHLPGDPERAGEQFGG